MIKSETQIIDQLFLELSHVTNAKTEREIYYERRVAESTNYVCDKPDSPTAVIFNNGRKVSIVRDADGSAYLDIGWAGKAAKQ